jgi:hypothetical protein
MLLAHGSRLPAGLNPWKLMSHVDGALSHTSLHFAVRLAAPAYWLCAGPVYVNSKVSILHAGCPTGCMLTRVLCACSAVALCRLTARPTSCVLAAPLAAQLMYLAHSAAPVCWCSCGMIARSASCVQAALLAVCLPHVCGAFLLPLCAVATCRLTARSTSCVVSVTRPRTSSTTSARSCRLSTQSLTSTSQSAR